jgi:serine/threonine protein kinase
MTEGRHRQEAITVKLSKTTRQPNMNSPNTPDPLIGAYSWQKLREFKPGVELWEDTEPPNKRYVIKKTTRTLVEREVKLLTDMQNIRQHENIVPFHRTMEYPNDAEILGLVLAYCGQGDVLELCNRHWSPKIQEHEPQRVPESLIWKIAMESLNGLHFMHTSCESSTADPSDPNWLPIIHCDIKHTNLFLDSDGTVRIGDFGYSTTLPTGMVWVHWYAGSPGFFAPEYPEVSQASDIWSLGVTIHYCATGQTVRPESNSLPDSSEGDDQHSKSININDLTVNGEDSVSNGGQTVRPVSDMALPDSDDSDGQHSQSINIHDLTVKPEYRISNGGRIEGRDMATWPPMGVYSATLNHFLQRMLALDPEERPTAFELLRDMKDVHDQIRRLGRSREKSFDEMIASLPLVTPCGPPLIDIDSD